MSLRYDLFPFLTRKGGRRMVDKDFQLLAKDGQVCVRLISDQVKTRILIALAVPACRSVYRPALPPWNQWGRVNIVL